MVKISSEFQIAFESYINVKGLDEKTKKEYLFNYHKFINLYPDLNQKNNSHPPARAMVKNLLSSIKRWEFPAEIKQEIAVIDIPKRTAREGKKQPKFIKKSDIDMLDKDIDSGKWFDDERLKLMILVQFYGALRINELINLKYEDFNFTAFNREKKFQIVKVSSESAKFGKEGKTYIPTEVFIRLVNWLKTGIGYNKIKGLKGTNIPLWNIRASRYKKLLAKWTLKILGEAYNSHSLRHGRGHNLITEEGQSIEITQRYLRHADIKSTQIYTHIGDSDMDKALN